MLPSLFPCCYSVCLNLFISSKCFFFPCCGPCLPACQPASVLLLLHICLLSTSSLACLTTQSLFAVFWSCRCGFLFRCPSSSPRPSLSCACACACYRRITVSCLVSVHPPRPYPYPYRYLVHPACSAQPHPTPLVYVFGGKYETSRRGTHPKRRDGPQGDMS